MHTLPPLYYINLEYRIDRNSEMLEWLDDSGFPEENIHRISAEYTPGRGHLGCVLSHIKALQTFLNSTHDQCIIFEDDYVPIDVSTYWRTIQKIYDDGVDFDILLLAHNVAKTESSPVSYLERVVESFTTSGYIITRNCAKALLDRWKESVELLQQEEKETGKKTHKYMLDVYWTKILEDYKAFCFKTRIGYQRASYSDLQMKYTDYKA
jgi:GR25 family glycosyltransferase involved in LPS biosynthesis